MNAKPKIMNKAMNDIPYYQSQNSEIELFEHA